MLNPEMFSQTCPATEPERDSNQNVSGNGNPPPSPEPYPDFMKTMALATGTDWRPPDSPFFIRSYILNASMDETYFAYWQAVYFVGSGSTPESAIESAVAQIIREWDFRKPGRARPMIARRPYETV